MADNITPSRVTVHPHGEGHLFGLPEAPIAYFAPHPSGHGGLVAYAANRPDRDDCFIVLEVSESVAHLRRIVPNGHKVPVRWRAWSEMVTGDEAAAMVKRFNAGGVG